MRRALQKYPRFRTELLQRGSWQLRADFVVKVLGGLLERRRSAHA